MKNLLLGLASAFFVIILVGCLPSDDGDDNHHGSDTSSDVVTDPVIDPVTDPIIDPAVDIQGDVGVQDASEAFLTTCLQFYDYQYIYCGGSPNFNETCEELAALGTNSGCMSEYETLMACIGEHQSEWSCEPSYCLSELETVMSCLDPYCEEHPEEC
ncbi:MAG: hypothetical protein JW797_01405 [Bradymonadales bacterium]|nr:hypothetical protein [Bradymonadales bacterium]